MSVEEIVSEFSEQPAEVITERYDENEDEGSEEQITHPSRNEVDKGFETLNRLSLLTENSRFDPLISKVTRNISYGSRDKVRKVTISIRGIEMEHWAKMG